MKENCGYVVGALIGFIAMLTLSDLSIGDFFVYYALDILLVFVFVYSIFIFSVGIFKLVSGIFSA